MYMGQHGVVVMTDHQMIHPYVDNVFPKTGIYVNPQGIRINSTTPEIYTGGETANHGIFNLSYLGGISMCYGLVSGYLAGASAADYALK